MTITQNQSTTPSSLTPVTSIQTIAKIKPFVLSADFLTNKTRQIQDLTLFKMNRAQHGASGDMPQLESQIDAQYVNGKKDEIMSVVKAALQSEQLQSELKSFFGRVSSALSAAITPFLSKIVGIIKKVFQRTPVINLKTAVNCSVLDYIGAACSL